MSKAEGVKANDPQEIYLCDHAWTFRYAATLKDIRVCGIRMYKHFVPLGRPNAARTILECHEPLRKRLAALMDLTSSTVEDVLPRIWRYAQTYSVESSRAEDALPVW